MKSLVRRELLGSLGRSVIAGVALLMLCVEKRPPPVGINTGDSPSGALSAQAEPPSTQEALLLLEASQWIDRLRARGTTELAHPVLHLQREFRLGYGRACALADGLAQHGEWAVAYDCNGTRFARIQRRA